MHTYVKKPRCKAQHMATLHLGTHIDKSAHGHCKAQDTARKDMARNIHAQVHLTRIYGVTACGAHQSTWR